MTPEKAVKIKIQAILKDLGAYYAMPIGTGYGNAGVPDFLVCLNGYFIGIEAKAGKGKTTALQDKNLRQIEAAGGYALIVNEDNLPELRSLLLEQMKSKWLLGSE
jgi:hypothetical protein